jgi:hypothetical protein
VVHAASNFNTILEGFGKISKVLAELLMTFGNSKIQNSTKVIEAKVIIMDF